jgi:hypothetical protein
LARIEEVILNNQTEQRLSSASSAGLNTAILQGKTNKDTLTKIKTAEDFVSGSSGEGNQTIAK